MLEGEPVESVQETAIEEEFKPVVKAKAKAKAKQKIKITKQTVESIKEEEPIKEKEHEPVVGDRPKQIDKNKQLAQCPGCNLSMAVHTKIYS